MRPVTDSSSLLVRTPEQGRFFAGWTMLGVATVAFIATGPGQTVVVSQFNTAIREDLGLSASGLGASYMIGTLAAALPLVLTGKASDRFGPRVVMGVVAACLALACATIGMVEGVVGLTVAFFLLRFLGQGSLGLVSGHLLALWFERRLGTANGLKLVGANAGFAIMPAVALALIEGLGWRSAYAALGAIVAALVLPLVIWVARDHPEEVGQRIDGDPSFDPPGHEHDDEVAEFDPTGHRHIDPAFTLGWALRSWQFWTVACSAALNGLIGTALIFHAQPLLEAQGADPNLSAGAVRVWSLTMMVAIFPAGWLADRVPVRVLLPIALALVCVACGVMLAPLGEHQLHLAMLIFGVSQAVSIGVAGPTVARYFGRAHHGAIRAAATVIGVVGTGLGPVLLGLSIDHLESFAPGIVLFAAMCAPPALAAMWLRHPVQRLAAEEG
jgi:MFS family permease